MRAEVVRETRERGVQKKIGVRGAGGGCEKGKLLQIVPGGRVHPGEFGLGGLGANEASRVGDTKSAHGTNVGEKGVVDGRGDEPVIDGLVELGGRRQEDAVGSFEAQMVEVWGDGRGSSLDEDVVLGTIRL
jgi:hypothetical protein